LGGDAAHLADASGVKLRIELSRAPVQEGVAELASAAGREADELACGGEDFELLACLPPNAVQDATAAVDAVGGRLTVVGEVLDGEGVDLLGSDGVPRPLGGFDHLIGA
jgi:thiamine-monophosphate kinase